MDIPLVALAARMTHWAVGGDNGTESFGRVQPGCDICEDVCEAHVILGGQQGLFWQVHICPSLEPDARFLVCANREGCRDDSGGFHGDGLKKVQDVIAIDCEGRQRLG